MFRKDCASFVLEICTLWFKQHIPDTFNQEMVTTWWIFFHRVMFEMICHGFHAIAISPAFDAPPASPKLTAVQTRNYTNWWASFRHGETTYRHSTLIKNNFNHQAVVCSNPKATGWLQPIPGCCRQQWPQYGHKLHQLHTWNLLQGHGAARITLKIPGAQINQPVEPGISMG